MLCAYKRGMHRVGIFKMNKYDFSNVCLNHNVRVGSNASFLNID